MPYTVALPDGRTVEFPDEVSHEQAAEILRKEFGGPPQEDPRKQGLMAAMDATAARGQAGMARLFGNGELGEKLERYAKENYQPTQQSWSEAPWEKLKESAGEALPGLVGVIGGSAIAGPFGAFGMGAMMGASQNVERQVAPTEEGGAGRSQDEINRGAALGMAIPEGALNAIGVRMLPGVKSILGEAFGHKVSDAVAQAVAKQGLKATAIDLAKSSGVGALDMGVMGVANTFMERLQAGLSTGDPQARDEYLHSLLGGAAFGAIVGPGGRMLERSGLKAQAGAADRKAEAEETKRQEAAKQQEDEIEAQRQQTPEFVEEATQRYEALQKRWAELEEATKAPVDKDDFAGQKLKQDARKALKEFRDSEEFKTTVDDYLKVKPQLDEQAKAKTQAETAAEEAKARAEEEAAARKEDYAADDQTKTQQHAEGYTHEEWQAALARLAKMREDAADKNQALHESGEATLDERIEAAAHLTQLEEAHNRLAQLNVPEPTDPQQRIKFLEKQVEKAIAKGESPEQPLREIKQLQDQIEQRKQTTPQPYEPPAAGTPLAEQMGQGREEAEATRKKVEDEIAALRRIADKRPTSPEYLETLATAMGETAGFMPPPAPGSTLHLPEDLARQKYIRDARKKLAAMKQKEGSTVPMDSWLAAKRQQRIEEAEAQLNAMGPPKPTGQTELAPGPVTPPVNLHDESDKRVSALIDHYLPKATPKPGQALPATDMNARAAFKNKIAQAQRIKHDSFLELADFFQNVKRDQPEKIGRGRVLQRRFIEAAIAETDLRRQAQGNGPLSAADKADLHDVLTNVANDMARLALTRNADNSYKYGHVQGYVDGMERKPGAMTPQQAQELQAELQWRRKRAMELQWHIDRQGDLQSLGVSADRGEARNFAQESVPVRQLHNALNATNARINEITHLLAAHIRGEDMQSVVIPKEVRGSNAPLSERTLGSPGHAVNVLEEEVHRWMDAYVGEKKPEAPASGPSKPVTVIKSDQRAPALTNFELLEKVRANAQRLAEINRLLAEPITNLERGTTREALEEQRRHLVEQDQYLRSKYNGSEAHDSTEEAMGRRLNRELDFAEAKNDTARIAVLRKKWSEWAARNVGNFVRADEHEQPTVVRGSYPNATQPELPGVTLPKDNKFKPKAPEPKAMTEAQQRLAHATEAVKRLQKAVAATEANARDSATINSEMQLKRREERKKLEHAVKLAEAQIVPTQKRLDTLTKRWNDPDTPSADLERLKKNIDKNTTELMEKQADLQEAQKELAKHHAQEATRGEANVKAKTELANKHVASLRNQLSRAQRAADRARADIETLNKRATKAADYEAAAKRRAMEQEAARRGVDWGDLEAERIARERAKPQPPAAEPETSLQRTEKQALRETGEITDKQGKTLLGERRQRDTSGKIMTAEADMIKKQIARADNAMTAAQAAGKPEVAARIAKTKDALLVKLDQQYERAPIKTTNLGGEQRAAPQPGVVEGARLANRREGPLVRNISGANKKATQSGAARLHASGMRHDDANAVSLYRLKARLDAAKDKDAKAQLKAEWERLTQGVSDVDAVLAKGKELTGLGPTDEIIGKRQQLREAIEAVDTVRKELTAAKKGSPEYALLEDRLERAERASDKAEKSYVEAKEAYEKSKVKAENEKPQTKAEKRRAKRQARIDAEFDELGTKEIKGKGDIVEPDEIEADDGPLFRTTKTEGPAMPRAHVERLAKETTSRWKNAPDVEVVQSESQLPFDVPADKRGQVPGAYHDGKVYLVADNLRSPNDVALTLAHEIAGHHGLRAMLGDAYTRTMNALYEGNERVRTAADKKMREENLSRDVATEEVLAEMAETNPKDSALKRAFYAVKQALFKMLGIKNISDGEVAQLVANARRYVEEGGPGGGGGGTSMTGPVFRTTNPKYDALVARKKTTGEHWSEAKDVGLLNAAKTWAAMAGLKIRMTIADQHGAYEKAVRLAEKNEKIGHDVAVNAMHALRFGGNVNQGVGQFVGTGPVYVKTEKLPSGVISRTFGTKRGGPTLKKVFEHVGDGARELGVHPDEAAQIATTLAVGRRAEATPNGWERLQTDIENMPEVRALYKETEAMLAANPQAKAHFDTAMKHYKAYNDGLIDFLAQTGAISKAMSERLKAVPYAPWYRVDNDEIKLISDKEKPIVLGNLKDSPELQQMLGGSNKVMPLLESSVKNTYLITRMAMRNHQQTAMANTLWQIGAVSKMGKGSGPADKSVLHYKVDGEDHFASVDKDVYGVPAELMAKGMEGIKTTLPAFTKMMAVPAHWVRTMVTRAPTYAVRQMVRDPVNVVFVDGMSPAGVADAFKHIGKALVHAPDPVADHLMDSLAITSNIYANDAGDIQKFLRQAASGNGDAVNKALRRLDEFAQEADGATRQALYTDGIKKGLSDAESQLRVIESMNFNRRGLSPSMQMLSTMIPFFNAQIQGLDVLWRSLRGHMPLNDKLDIQRKLYLRGLLMTGASLAYSAVMQDDPEYRKQRPQDRYQNFLIKTPFSKDYLRIPIPYEIGVITKALPEAIWDAAHSDTRTRDVALGLFHVAANSLPNLQPPAIAPLVMASLNYSGFGPIESKRDQSMEAEMRYRETTPEMLKAMGTGGSRLAEQMGLPFGVSPLMLEFFVRSYTGTMGLGIMRLLGDPAALAMQGKKDIPHATGTAADTPMLGSLFTRAEGRYLIDRAYERMDEITHAKKTYDEMVAQGKLAEAKRYAQDKSNEIAMAGIAGSFRQELGQWAAQERVIRSRPDLSTAQKDKAIEAIKKAENARSEAFYKGTTQVGRTTPQAARP